MTTQTQAANTAPQATSERIADYLRGAILSGEIPPGARIRQEEIGLRLGASRLPVREALRMLEAEGLTEHEANKGARVPRLTDHEVDVVYQMRERLEPLALAQSLMLLSDVEIDHLEELQDRIEAGTDLAEFLLLDREFHLASYAACDTEQLLTTVTRLWNSTQHHRRTFMLLTGPERRWVVNYEHRLLVDAIRRRDAVDAERHLCGHIRRTRVELAQHGEAGS